MLRPLRHWWQRFAAGIPKSEVVDSIPESQWDRADLQPPVSKARRKAFSELLALAASHLPPQEAAALVEHGATAFTRSDEVGAALSRALGLEEEAQGQPYQRGFMAFDWKGAGEVPWQADALCQAHRLSGRWSAPPGDLTSRLCSLDAWLQGQGLVLLCVSEGDGLLAFALRTDQRAPALALGRKLKLRLGAPGDA